jgi:hypothetical protein
MALNTHPRSAADADWTVRLAMGGAAGFLLLLVAFALVLYNAWPQMSGVRQTVSSLGAKTDRIAGGQEQLTRDITGLRNELRDDRNQRAGDKRDAAAAQTRISELATTVSDLRRQTEKLAAAPVPSAAQTRPAPQDPAVAELRAKLDVLQRRLDQLAATQTAPAPQPTQPSAAEPQKKTVQAAPKPFNQVDEAEREVREMQDVIRKQREGVSPKPEPVPVRAASVAPLLPPVRTTPSIADPLAPMISKTRPRIAPEPKGMSPTALVSWAPPTASATPREPEPQSTPPKARVTLVGVNSGERMLGPIAVPFDALGNLVVAIGEGLDHFFTGRTYLPRPAGEPAQARR